MPNKRKAFIYISNGYYFDVGPGTSSDTVERIPVSLPELKSASTIFERKLRN